MIKPEETLPMDVDGCEIPGTTGQTISEDPESPPDSIEYPEEFHDLFSFDFRFKISLLRNIPSLGCSKLNSLEAGAPIEPGEAFSDQSVALKPNPMNKNRHEATGNFDLMHFFMFSDFSKFPK
uniref:Uncharacterized protein n=1 Tax=Romanomermis culicivorax TaxID=13658 RepID=A0A915K5T9_ROMCU